MKQLLKRSGLAIAALLISVLAFGQGVTTSVLSGRVVDNNGDPLPGATVVALHNPSGSQYGTATSMDGRFFIPALRVGGPYTVTVSFVGYQEATYTDIFLSLGTDNLFKTSSWSHPIICKINVIYQSLMK